MLTVSKFRADSFSTGFMDIQWEIAPTEEVISEFTFYLYRSGAEEGPWVLITPNGLIDRFSFRDIRVNLYAKRRDYFYRLEIRHPEQGSVYYGPIHRFFQPDLIALEIARMNAMNLRTNIGQLCFIFKQRKFGTECTCFDKKIGHKIITTCLTCFNTGWVGGYYRPIVTWVNIQDSASNLVQTPIGDVEKNYGQGEVADYPLLEPRDVIVDQANRRWRVLSPINYKKKGGTIVKQVGPLAHIEPSEVEYKIKIYKNGYDKYAYVEHNYERKADYYATEDDHLERLNWGKKMLKDIERNFPFAEEDYYLED